MEAARRQYRQKETTWAPPLQRDPGPWSRLVINWMATLAVIMVFGLVMLYSASYTTGYLRMGDSLHYIKQQILCMAIGIGCMAAMSYVDHRFLRWACKPCYWIVLIMLAATLAFPPLNGCRRWIRLGGLTLQTSEVAKFEMILLTAHLASSAPQIGRFRPSLKEKVRLKDWLFIRIVRQIILPVLPLVPVLVLLIMEPHMSGILLTTAIVGTILMMSGSGGIITWAGAGTAALLLETLLTHVNSIEYLQKRLKTWSDDLEKVNPQTKQVALINTPRDYYVDLAGTNSKDKLTHAGLYGVETSMATLGNLYGVSVDHYIRINFAGFINIVDALGGVDVYSDQAFTSVGSPGYYDPTTFAEGWNHLDGKSALAFARERHAFASGDIQRGINQMKVIDAMLNKIKSPALLMGFSKIMDAASDCFVTDFSQDQISALVRMQLSDFANWDIQSYTVTGSSGTSTQCYSAKGQKLYVMKPDEASVSKAKEMIATVLGGEGTVSDTTQTPEKTDIFTPTTDPNAAASIPEEPAESVIVEEPAESVPEETPAETPAEQPAEQPADTQPQEPETPADSGTSDGSTEAPSISLPSQEEMEQAASSLYNAASTILDAIYNAASQNDAA